MDLLLAAAVAGPMVFFGAIATYDRGQALAAAERDVLATLDILHGHAEKVLQFQSLALGAVQERLRGQADAEVLAAAGGHHAHLRALRAHAAEMLGLVVFGADGRPLVDSERVPAKRTIDVTDREYFQWHRATPGTGTFLAATTRSRTDGSPVLFVTQRRSGPDGGFAGVLAAGVPQAALTGAWRQATPDPSSVVTLMRRDGTVLVRQPALDAEAEPRLPPHAPAMRVVQEGAERQVRTIAADGERRLAAFRPVARFPDVVVAHAVPVQAALAPWRRRLMVYGAFAGAASLALVLLALLARRSTHALHELNGSLERRIAERTAEIRAGEERVRLLAREVDHRAKNALAVVQAALRLTPKTDPQAYAEAVEGRVAALARAQSLLAADRWRGADLRMLLEAELAPFLPKAPAQEGTGPAVPRARLDGPSVMLPATAAQPLAMAVHELATNALKHGALSAPRGLLHVAWRTEFDWLEIRWTERGGPGLAGAPERRGFGSRVLDSVVRTQLRGAISLAWLPEGLVAEIRIPLALVAAEERAG